MNARVLTAPIPRFALITGALHPQAPCRLPALPGSELRGLLTQGLTRIQRHHPDDPPPFTLTPDWLDPTAAPDHPVDHPADHPIPFRLTWYGPEPDPAPLIAAAFTAIGWQPLLGRGHRAPFTATATTTTPAAAMPAALIARFDALTPAEAITLRTLTPLALRDRGAMRQDLHDARPLITSIRHRATKLAHAFTPTDLAPLPLPATPLVTLADHTHPLRYRREGRAGRYTPIEAITGAARFARPDPDALATLILGEALCAGRWTAFGAGHYHLEATCSDLR